MTWGLPFASAMREGYTAFQESGELADLELAVNGIAAGIFPAGGQSCISGSRLLVHESVIDEFSARLVDVVGKARVGDPNDPRTQIGPMANRPHYEAILKRIAAAEAAGHRLLLDGRVACRDRE